MTSLLNDIKELKNEVVNRKKEHYIQTSPNKWREEYLYEDLNVKLKTIRKRRRKVPNVEFEVPSYNEYENILIYNYNISQLKSICRFYKQKIGGNKGELMKRVYNYLKYSSFSVKIQSLIRGKIVRKLCKLKNIKDIKNSINDTDFLSLDDISKLKFKEIFCYTDSTNNSYIFSIKSLYNYYKNSSNTSKLTNPYNRKQFEINIKNKLKKIRRLNKILGYKLNLSLEDDDEVLSYETKIEVMTTSIFQKMDESGFITNTSWFLDLDSRKLKRFYSELIDTFSYRAQLSNIQKNRILPQYVSKISNINNSLFNKELNKIRSKILKLIDSFVSDGIDQESRSLGVFYVLGSLTTVSYDAAVTLPWLFESFAHL